MGKKKGKGKNAASANAKHKLAEPVKVVEAGNQVDVDGAASGTASDVAGAVERDEDGSQSGVQTPLAELEAATELVSTRDEGSEHRSGAGTSEVEELEAGPAGNPEPRHSENSSHADARGYSRSPSADARDMPGATNTGEEVMAVSASRLDAVKQAEAPEASRSEGSQIDEAAMTAPGNIHADVSIDDAALELPSDDPDKLADHDASAPAAPATQEDSPPPEAVEDVTSATTSMTTTGGDTTMTLEPQSHLTTDDLQDRTTADASSLDTRDHGLPDSHDTGAELGFTRPAIYRKASEENAWGARRQLADVDVGDGDIGAGDSPGLDVQGIDDGKDKVLADQAGEDVTGEVIEREQSKSMEIHAAKEVENGDIGAGVSSHPGTSASEERGHVGVGGDHSRYADGENDMAGEPDEGDITAITAGIDTRGPVDQAEERDQQHESRGDNASPATHSPSVDSTPDGDLSAVIQHDNKDSDMGDRDTTATIGHTDGDTILPSPAPEPETDGDQSLSVDTPDALGEEEQSENDKSTSTSKGELVVGRATDKHAVSNGDDYQNQPEVKPSFRSINPSFKPSVPASRAISVSATTDVISLGGHEDDDMADVPISLSPNMTQRRDESADTGEPSSRGSAAGDQGGNDGANGVRSPTKRSWFSFGRRKTDEKISKSDRDAENHANGSVDKGKPEDDQVPYGYARPPMSARSLSSGVQSVHSVHSVHSAYSGRSVQGISSQMGSEAGGERVSRPGSALPSRAASPVPATAVSEQATSQPATPRRHAPAAHPFPFPIPPSPERDPSGERLPPADESGEPPADGPADSATGPGASDDAAAPTSVAAAAATIVPQPVTSPLPSASAPPAAESSASSAKVDHGIGAKGVSTFEKVMNYTRPQHLPPKTREEDDTHYHQWEEMMAVARQHQAEKRRAAEVRRLEREKKLAAYLPKWEMLLQGAIPNLAKVREDETTREMWFQGVPGHLRNKAWTAAIGNPLAMSKDAYRSYVARANKAISSGRFPQDTLDAIERDMSATLPQTKMFVAASPMRMDLQELLTAWVVYRSDDGLGYAPYVSHIAAMLLIPSPPAQAFLNLVNFLSRPCLRAFVTETRDEIDAFYRVFENLQADTFPKIYANCSNLGLRLPQSYFRSVLVEQVPFEACCRLWDQIVLDGDGYIFRAALAIFGFLEPRLHFPDKEEILSVLEGRNKATHAITEREKERARLRGEAYDDELDGKLSVFGLNEDALFEWLAHDGWKEARYERLVTREMPD